MMVLAALAAASHAAEVLADVYFVDRETLGAIAQRYDVWEVNHSEGWVRLRLTSDELAALDAQGLSIATHAALPSAPEKAMLLTEPEAGDAEDHGGIPGYSCYERTDTLYAHAAQLAASHPDRARWVPFGTSWDGQPLMVLQLGTPGTPDVVMVSGTHAREYAPVQAAMRFAETLLAEDGADPEATWLLDARQFHLVLLLNPDGRVVAEHQVLWRKNRRETDCLGVDLNRNYPFGWACCAGSSDDTCSEVYRGSEPGSEPEIEALLSYLGDVFPPRPLGDAPAPADTAGLFLDLHSYSELVLWPWGARAEPAPNADALALLGQKLGARTGYAPMPMIELYPTDGTSIDHVYATTGVASYTLEIGTAFFEACDTFNASVYPPLHDALRYAARIADAPYLTPAGPEAQVTLSAPAIRRRGRTQLQVTAEAAEAAEYSVGVPFGEPAAAPAPLSPAADAGVFGARLRGRQLGRGAHTLFVRAQDASGQWGVVTTVELVVD